MLVLGLILILLAVGLFVGFLSSGTQQVTFDSGILDVTMSTLTIFLLGALTLLLLVAGLGLLRSGSRRANQRRKEHKELGRLSKKLEKHEAEQRRDGAATTTTPTTTGPATTGTTATEHRVDEGGTTRG